MVCKKTVLQRGFNACLGRSPRQLPLSELVESIWECALVRHVLSVSIVKLRVFLATFHFLYPPPPPHTELGLEFRVAPS